MRSSEDEFIQKYYPSINSNTLGICPLCFKLIKIQRFDLPNELIVFECLECLLIFEIRVYEHNKVISWLCEHDTDIYEFREYFEALSKIMDVSTISMDKAVNYINHYIKNGELSTPNKG